MKKPIGALQEALMFTAAAWLVLAPVLLGYSDIGSPAIFASWGSGVLIYLSVSQAMIFPGVLDEWLEGIVAAGLIASPWLLGYAAEPAAKYNAVATGAVVFACAAFDIVRARKPAVSQVPRADL